MLDIWKGSSNGLLKVGDLRSRLHSCWTSGRKGERFDENGKARRFPECLDFL